MLAGIFELVIGIVMPNMLRLGSMKVWWLTLGWFMRLMTMAGWSRLMNQHMCSCSSA